MSQMLQHSLTIVNRKGLHVRAAAKIVKLATNFQSELEIRHRNETGHGNSILSLLGLSAGFGSELAVRVCGPDAEQLLEALIDLVTVRKFDEE